MTPSQECLFDVAWQLRRLEYSKSYETEEATREAISGMLSYIGHAKSPYWKFVRVWRCRNLVTFLIRAAERHENPTALKLLKKVAKGLELEFNRYKDAQRSTAVFKPWSWDKVRVDLRKLYDSDSVKFQQLLAYTYARLQGPGKEVPTEMLARPELARFYRTMRDVEFEGHG
jgi:hypothetical protein